nr:MAG TPA: hypothetical protein [Caudoviricetes sp.]DAT61069.1 MAG TPA: hypothetical protein [Caudoviricetes sp.]DAX72953.1 MAG TPA: hypothetical protein [Caudoviricetes sp.]
MQYINLKNFCSRIGRSSSYTELIFIQLLT